MQYLHIIVLIVEWIVLVLITSTVLYSSTLYDQALLIKEALYFSHGEGPIEGGL